MLVLSPSIKSALASRSKPWVSIGLRSLLGGCRNKSSVAPDNEKHGKYLFPLDEPQKNFFFAHRANTRYPAVWLVLNSKKPLTPEIIHKAVQHVYRKTHYYQLYVKERDGELWFCNDGANDVDFKVLEKGVAKYDVIDDLWYSRFNENGPNMKLRFMQADKNDPCPIPGLEREYPYQSYLLCVYHHSFTDGATGGFVSQALIDTINAVVEGDHIDDNVPLGELVSNEELEKAEQALKDNLLQDPKRFEAIKADVLKAEKAPLLLSRYPPPKVENPTTKNIYLYTPPDVLQKFFSQCQKNGVSPGSAFQAATNTALIELVQEAGATEDSYDISVNLATDLRRYMKPRKYPIYGLHVRTMTSVISMGKNVREDFWKNCREVENINKKLLKSGAVVEQNIVRKMTIPSTPAEEYYQRPTVLCRDYGYSNMGKLDRIVSGMGKHVQMSSIEQYSCIQHFIYPFFQQIFTLRGNFMYVLSYATDCLSEETANILANKVTSLITYYSEH